MKKIKTVIIEDEKVALRRHMKFAEENGNLELVGVAESGKKALDLITKTRPQLILLDIELKDMTAFEVLSGLKNTFEGQIIFITAYNEYAVKAFELAATDYLLKPYDKSRFDQAIQRAVEKEQYSNIHAILNLVKSSPYFSNKKIEINEGAVKHLFQADEILWIEADGYYSKIHKVDSSEILVRSTLKDMESNLPDSIFKRINRSSIINTNHIIKESQNIKQHHIFLKGDVKLKKSLAFK
ncbi:MAG: LytTR family DNA-binding domain-containing protein [Reichenbachiella sp.]|uniref:LytR/AlgR family response regulator transcription factor n=1 Tax=Reichenbachiella sp. TaxID=2184521 RepID=UPI0032657D92